MTVRPERPEEFDAIYALVKTAFLTASHCDGDEQDYVDGLRKSEKYIPELALVAEQDGALLGHIMLTSTEIEAQDTNTTYPAVLLSPLCVKSEYRKQGIGAALTVEALQRAKAMGHEIALLVGDPNYYARFGFKSASSFGLDNGDAIPEKYVMACELTEGALHGKAGKLRIV